MFLNVCAFTDGSRLHNRAGWGRAALSEKWRGGEYSLRTQGKLISYVLIKSYLLHNVYKCPSDNTKSRKYEVTGEFHADLHDNTSGLNDVNASYYNIFALYYRTGIRRPFCGRFTEAPISRAPCVAVQSMKLVLGYIMVGFSYRKNEAS
jgi:hypothetical protein